MKRNIESVRRVAILAALVMLPLAWMQPAWAQEKYPTRAIDIIVPFAAGGATDLAARATASYLSKRFGVPVNVVNKPGARGIPQTLEMYRAKPDGYTLFEDGGTTTTFLVASMGKDLGFDVFERTFLGMNVGTGFTAIVAPDSPYKTLDQLLDAAKKQPERVSYTSQGSTGVADYFARVLFSKAGIDVARMPAIMVTGASPTVTMVAGGNVSVGMSSASGALSAVKGGLVRSLVVSYQERDPDFPGVPTTVELGYPVVISWNGLTAPPKLPKHIADVLAKALLDSTTDPEFIASLRNIGAIPYYRSPEGMRDYVKKEIDEARRLFPPAK